MAHQLKPNTYTICESTEQCKELFEWAKANGIETYARCKDGETILSFDEVGELVAEDSIAIQDLNQEGSTFMPLHEFISRLKGEWVESKAVTLSDKEWDELMPILNSYAPLEADKIYKQLNKQ